MRSRAREERRLLREQDTIGALRAERLEQEALGSQRNVEIILTKAKKQARVEAERPKAEARPRREARPGKPLKR
jgi:hypothetical protein